MKKLIIISMFVLFTAMALGQAIYRNEGNARLAPRLINYQGYLTDTQGNPITNPSISMTFAIFDAVSGGNQKWTETQATVGVDKGIFNVLLGSATAIPDSVFTYSTSRWLQLTIGGQALAPRTRIVSSPYAYTSTYSDTAVYARNAAPDNDWTYHITDSADTTLQTGGRWGLARDGNVLYGSADSTHVNFGVACTTGTSGQNLKYCTVGGGHRNRASYGYATAAGGYRNYADTSYATVGGGYNNAARGYASTASGGWSNVADSNYATVGGGYNNNAIGTYATTSGGRDNTTSNFYATIAGGRGNTASGYLAAVCGGGFNTASGGWSTVGGCGNLADSSYSTVAGGYYNTVSGNFSFAGGGYYDTVLSCYSTVISGFRNRAGDEHADTAAVVTGGRNNAALGKFTSVGGGYCDTASGNYATVGGGRSNTASSFYTTVAGGYTNIASDYAATVGGGMFNVASDDGAFVGGGRDNTASGYYATVAGGYGNNADTTYATVAGGRNDTAKAIYGAVLGGYGNLAGSAIFDTAAAVCAGSNNTARRRFAFVGGGSDNEADSVLAFVGGGGGNIASGVCATVGGGWYNTSNGYGATIGGGGCNQASGYCATVAGGDRDTVAGDWGFAAGYNSVVPASYSFSTAFNGQTATASSQTKVGVISKAAGTFTIDHPLDPEHKILNHYFVESPEMVLIYRGIATIGGDGRCEVHLPDYFDVLNEKPQIQLTGVGTYEVYIARDVKDNSFIVGGKPGTEVHWTVTGARKDQSAEIAKIIVPVEQVKEGPLAGRSLDDDFLLTTKAQLERMGKAGGFKFRHASEQRRYEEMKKESSR